MEQPGQPGRSASRRRSRTSPASATRWWPTRRRSTTCAREVRRRLEGRLFVAHNARFDYGFVRNEFRRVGEKFAAPVLCTVRLSRALFREHARHNLDTLIERYGLDCEAAAPGARRCRRAAAAARGVRVGGRPRAAAGRGHGGAQRVAPAAAPAARSRRGPARGTGRVPVPRRRRRAAVRRQEPQPAQPGARALRERAPLGQGVEADAPGARGRVDRDGRRARRAAARVAAGEGTRTERQPALAQAGGTAVRAAGRARTAGSRCASSRWRRRAAGDEAELYGPFRTERDARRALEGKAREAGLCLKAMGLERGAGLVLRAADRPLPWRVRRPRAARAARCPAAARARLAAHQAVAVPWRDRYPRARAWRASGTVLHVIDRWRHLGTAADDTEVAALLECADHGRLRSGRLPHHRALPRARRATRNRRCCARRGA